jgi:tRNA-dihydrouridine synthase
MKMDTKEFLNMDKRQMKPYEFWELIGSPKYVCAPMVDQSELSFRKLLSNYNCDLYYTPMIHSV